MLSINGASYDLKEADPAQSLVSFIRQQAGDQSVQLACGSGACGACTVAAIEPDGRGIRTINSCLAPVGSLAGCSIVTSGGMGSSRAGFHPVQERMGAFHASQCGFCTPGFVAALGAALHEAQTAGREPDAAELARRVDGNLCRCTGFRPIMDVCKSFAKGVDIEDLGLHTPLSGEAAAPWSAGGGRLLLAAATASSSQGSQAACNGAGPGCNGGSAEALRLEGGGRVWVAPDNLQQLLDACAAAPATGAPPRFLGGNTGAGLFCELWPASDGLVVTLGHVKEMREVAVAEGHLLVGAAVTIAELAAALSSHAAKLPGGQPFASLAAMLARIAGSHVRQAGTVGGNLALARSKGLESDLATALMGWGATVILLDVTAPASANGGGNGSSNGGGGGGMVFAEARLERFLGGERGLGEGQLLVALHLPLPQPGDYFWCHKLAEAHSSVHSTLNAAVKLGGGSARAVFGFYSSSGWVTRRAAATEAALAGKELSSGTLAAALLAVVDDVAPARRPEYASMAQGLLLQALAPAVKQHYAGAGGCPAHLERLLEVPPANEVPPVMRGRQTFDPAPSGIAPLGAPLGKDRVLLQASGEAQYTGDVPAPPGTLAAAWVTSAQACAPVLGIDASAALQLPGVVAFISAADLPPERNRLSPLLPMPPEPLLAGDRVEYHSQPLGIVVAHTQAAAMQGAEAVAVSYCPPEPPVLSIEAARERGALYQLPGGFGGCDKASGDAAAAIEAAPLRIRGGSIAVPGVYHMYMEPQNALALPDEGGSLKIYSACQDIDCVQKAVAHSLGMRQHDVEAVCRRAGGGFGGKAMRNLPVAVGAAVAAVRTGRPVRFVQDRRTDMRLNAGRCEVMAEYDVGFTTEGVIEGLHIRAFLLLGAYPDIPCDAMVLNSLMGMAYALPNFSLTSRLCRGNLPPMTAMRAPGDAQAAFIMEQIMEHVATQCGLAAAAVRERNFARLPDPAPEQALAPAAAEGEDAEAKPVADKGEAPVVRLSLGKEIPVGDYTLPRLWEQLKRSCGYEERMAAAQRFNADSPWVKRGLGMTHTRFDCYIASKAAYVSIYPDGSVVVFAGRSELGQGLTTKVLQVALMELSTLLPAASRPLPVSLVRMGDQSSYILPSTNMTGGSTTSESACIAVRQACQQLVERMRPFADKLGPQSTWAELMAAVVPPSGGFGGPKVPLTAYGHVGGDVQYCVFGAACCEAELNVLTGERRLLRCDLAMDVGRSMNPAIDIGQIEGALSMGLGQALSEARRHDPATGRLLTDSLWTYHPPIAASMPQELNVTLLPGSSLERSVLSAKAVGEPPLMLATSALSALQAAARDACAELAALGAIEAPGTTPLIRLPATPESLVAAMGGGARNLAAAFAG